MNAAALGMDDGFVIRQEPKCVAEARGAQAFNPQLDAYGARAGNRHVIGDRELPHDEQRFGEARFKRLFCTEMEPLFDTFRPLTARGSIAALGYRLGYRLKSKIKRSPTIWDAYTTFRRRSLGR